MLQAIFQLNQKDALKNNAWGGQNLYELAFETVVKFITSQILDVKREKTHRECFPVYIQNF